MLLIALWWSFETEVTSIGGADAISGTDMSAFTPLLWSDEYKIWIDMIDNEHKSLLSSFNRFINQINRYEETASVRYGLDILESYASYHFKHEEEIMTALGFSELDEHISLHNKMIDELMGLKAALLKRTLTGTQFCELFRKWLIDHIMDEDRKIAEFVKHRAEPAVVKAAFGGLGDCGFSGGGEMAGDTGL